MTLTDTPPTFREDTHGATSAGRIFKSVGQRYALVVIWLAMILMFTAITGGSFFNINNFINMFTSQSVLLVIALGVVLPLTTNDFDLSIGSVLTLSSMLVVTLNAKLGVPLLVAVAAALAAGLLVGAVNSALIVGLKVDSFIVTLGMSTLVLGVVYWFSGSAPVTGVDPVLVDVVLRTRPAGISMIFFYGLFLTLVVWYLLELTPLGRKMLFIGRGASVARLSGVKVGRVRVFALMGCSFMAALAGILFAGTTGGADPTSGATFLLPAFAAVFLGTTVVKPGRMNAWGTLIAVYFLVTGISGLQQLGVQNYVQQLFYGAALLIAVTISTILKRRTAGRP